MAGAYQEAIQGIRNCQEVGLRVGLRVTLTQFSYANLTDIFDIVDAEDIPRVCFYHLAYAGRGDRIVKYDLSHEETRAAVDLIFERTLDFARARQHEGRTDRRQPHRRRLPVPDDAADASRSAPTRCFRCCAGRAGTSRASPSATSTRWATSTPTSSPAATRFGNVRERPFSEIWSDESEPVLAASGPARPHQGPLRPLRLFRYLQRQPAGAR